MASDNNAHKQPSHAPPIRQDSLNFPTNRLPQLNVDIISRLPALPQDSSSAPPDNNDDVSSDPFEYSSDLDPSIPGPIKPEKSMFNLWAETETQTEIHWSKPGNAIMFTSLTYEIQIKEGHSGEWVDLKDNRLPLFRIYFVEGKALFGKVKITQSSGTSIVLMRIRAVGMVDLPKGREEKRIGPWSNNILFTLEGSNARSGGAGLPPMPPI